MLKNLSRDIKIAIMRFLDKAPSVSYPLDIYPSIYVLVNNRDLMRNYGFDDKIINHSFKYINNRIRQFRIIQILCQYMIKNISVTHWLNTVLLKFLNMHMRMVCHWNKHTLLRAAGYGHLDYLRYAH